MRDESRILYRLCVCVWCELCAEWLRNVFFFFFKQKTAYEMRISDWSSDVCSSDLPVLLLGIDGERDAAPRRLRRERFQHLGKRRHASVILRDFVARMQIGRASCRERVCQYV